MTTMRGFRGNLPLSLLLACGTATLASAADEDQPLDELVVTGSRIPVGSTGAATPLTVLDRHDIERRGQDTLGQVLQSMSFSASAMNTNVNNGGDGSERLDLRGLSPKRTLVLLNGRRLPNGGLGGDDSVDLGTIPLSLIERVEVLTSGATAVYGADAVAGVVNVITRQAAPGLEIGVKNSLTEKGDGRVTVAQISGGREIAGGNWMIGGEFAQQQPVLMSARNYSAVPMQFVNSDFALARAGSSATPNGRFYVPGGNVFGLDEGPYYRAPGAVGQSANNWIPFDPFSAYPDPSNVFNYAPYNYLQTPYQRESVWLLGSQPLAGGVTLFAEGMWHARKSSQLLAPTPYFSGIDATPVLSDGSLGIPADNYYNPFGVDIPIVRRRFVELPQRELQQDISNWRALLGLRGELAGWHWEVSYAEAHSHASNVGTGLPSAVRLLPALGPSGPDASGNIVCGSRDSSGVVPAANVIPGCVPVDLFDGAGSITPQQANYLDVTLRDHGDDAQRFLSLNARGPLGSLPAGALQWSVGAEYRRESGDLYYDPLGREGVVSVTAQSDITHAQFDARELFIEGRAPIFNSVALGSLDATAGFRYSRFSTFGTSSTWEAGMHYQPFISWALRATFSQVQREPNLQELYQTQVTQRIQESDDPCGAPSAAQRVHCAANGVPGGEYQENPADEWNNLVGGNRKLAPERGNSFDAGIDFQPASWRHLKMSFDYFNVELNGFVENPSPFEVLQECADHGSAAVCAMIHRAADGSILQVDTVASNFGRAVSSGFDAASHLEFDVINSKLSVGLAATYLARRDTQPFIGGATTRGAGYFVDSSLAFPHWRGNGFVEIRRPTWHVSYALQLIGPYSECGDGDNFLLSTDCYRISPRVYHDIEAGFTAYQGLELRAGITNLTNAEPPFVNSADGNTDTSTYRLLGRSYFAGIRYRFD